MVPDDANINGNVHGGTILKLMEEAGAIAAARYCNNVTNNVRFFGQLLHSFEP